MGTFEVNVRVISLDESAQEGARMLVDTGATFSLLPASFLRRLGVREQLQVETEYALRQAQDKPTGEVGTAPLGWAFMEIEGFPERLPALIMFGNEGARPLLGAHALEAFRLTVDPEARVLRRGRALLM